MNLDRIKIGAAVRVTHRPDRDRGYVKEARGTRQIGDTLTGVVIAEHDSHGLCYEVKFTSVGTWRALLLLLARDLVVTYDREELELVTSPSTEETS